MPGGNENDLWYLAGLFDGEGTVEARLNSRTGTVKRKTDDFSLRLIIFNTNDLVMAWLVSRFGGTVKTQHRKYGRTIYAWSLAFRRNEALIRSLVPCCIIKRRQLELLLELGQLMGQPGCQYVLPEVKARRLELVRDIRADKWRVA